MKPRHLVDATTRLMIAMGAVSRRMASADARKLAAGKAAAIPRTWHEKHNSRHADLVRRARTFLRALPDYPEDLLDQAAKDACDFRSQLAGAAEFSRKRIRLKSETDTGEAA